MNRRSLDVGDRIRRVLEESGVPWHAEAGKKHIKIFIADRLCAIAPRSRSEARRFGGDNALAAVKRAIRLFRAVTSGGG